MSLVEDKNALLGRFADAWEPATASIAADLNQADIPYFIENYPAEEKPEGVFARLLVRPNEIYHRAGGSDNPLMGRNGHVTVQICVPSAIGIDTAYQLADAARGIFHMWCSDDYSLRCEDSDLKVDQPLPKDPYYTVKLRTAYTSLKHG